MVTVTDTAAALLRENLDTNREAEHHVLRVSREGDDLSLAIDEEKDGDVVIQHEDRAVLVLEPSVAEALGDVIIDLDEDAQLIIKPGGHEYVD